MDATPVAADVSPVIAEDTAVEDVTGQDVVAQDVAAQDVVARDAVIQDVAAESIAALDTTTQDTTVEDTTVQDATAEGIAVERPAESASTDSSEASAVSAHDDAGIAATAPSAQNHAAISVIAESPPAAPTDADASDVSSREAPSDIEPLAVAEEENFVPVAEIEIAAEAVPEPVIGTDQVVEIADEVEPFDAEPVAVDAVNEPVDTTVVSNDPLPAEQEPVVTAEASPLPAEVESAPLDTPALVVADEHSTEIVAEVEAAVSEPCIASTDDDVLAEVASEPHLDSVSSLGDAVAIEPAPADIAAPVAAADSGSSDAASVVTNIASVPVSPSPVVRSAPKVRARPTEPADRAALIRQRWAESGIRMWNPRLHGTGEATLNIQGSVGLLPPAEGETMPRYDKLEFKLLGGQIVCEGVIVEAPAQASHRSFTRLAEPEKLERVREPARERQAALA